MKLIYYYHVKKQVTVTSIPLKLFMSFKDSLTSQLNYKSYYGYIKDDCSGYHGIFNIDITLPEIKFQLLLHDLDASKMKSKMMPCSLWEIYLTDTYINNHVLLSKYFFKS